MAMSRSETENEPRSLPSGVVPPLSTEGAADHEGDPRRDGEVPGRERGIAGMTSEDAAGVRGEIRGETPRVELADESAVPAPIPALPEQESTSARRGEATTKKLRLSAGHGLRWRTYRWRRRLAQINALEPTLASEDDAALRKRSLALRYRAMAGERLATLLPEAYALVREAGRRTLAMRHYDVQIIGGISLFEGHIAEMQTGEGKTLTATLPMYLHSLAGKGAHLATVNDYLAKRDADWIDRKSVV